MILLILLIGFILIKNRGSNMSISLAMLLLGYFFAFLTMILYLSKDSFYYNILTKYFQLPQVIWQQLFFLNISKLQLIRFLNLSGLWILLSGVFFALSTINNSYYDYSLCSKIGKIVITVYVVILAFIYDPQVNIQSYYFLYPQFLTPTEYTNITTILHTLTQWINIIIVLSSAIIVLITSIKLPRIRIIQLHGFSLTLCYFILCGCYCFLFSSIPAYFLRISKVSRTYTYSSIPLFDNSTLYTVLPYFLIIFTLLITYNFYGLSRIKRRLEKRDLNISKQISASETTSKVFCHYIKNEVLAIQCQIELLTENDENREALRISVERCRNLYNRIDSIHRSTKNSELSLQEINLNKLMTASINEFEGELGDYNVEINLPTMPIFALADAEYLGQALHNLIRNALDSMEELPLERKNISLYLRVSDRWVILSVSDTGVGIAKENQVNIFTPFVSSASFSKHWGVGLSLTYKIIKAHEGEIEVESTVDKGTSMKIILPNIKTIPKKQYRGGHGNVRRG